MKRFICDENKLYSSIINVCTQTDDKITFKNSKGEIITCDSNTLPKGLILAHPYGINVSTCLEKWINETGNRYKKFAPDFSLTPETGTEVVQVSKHLKIWLKVEGDKIFWKHPTHDKTPDVVCLKKVGDTFKWGGGYVGNPFSLTDLLDRLEKEQPETTRVQHITQITDKAAKLAHFTYHNTQFIVI